MTEETLKQELMEAGRRLDRKGLLCATEGNLSARLTDGSILITASGTWKGKLTPQDFVVVDLKGTLLHGEGCASSETAAHLSAYNQRDDIGAVIHAHAPHCTALTLADVGMDAIPLAEAAYVLGSVPTCRFAVPGTAEGGEVVREWITKRDALLLDRHGALTVGARVADALARMESLEAIAKVYWLALQTGREFRRMADDEIERTVEAALRAGVRTEAINAWADRVLERFD